VLYQGGNLDSAGRPVPNIVALHYNTVLYRWELGAQVWDTANQTFETDPRTGLPLWNYSFYTAVNVQQTVINGGPSNDVIHADQNFNINDPQFPGYNPTNPPISIPGYDPSVGDKGDVPSGIQTTALPLGIFPMPLVLNGEAGNDQIFGGPEADIINGGDGADILYGGLGNDSINGGSGGDLIIGNNSTGADPYFLGTESDTTYDQATVLISTDNVNFTPLASNDANIGSTLLTDHTLATQGTTWNTATLNLAAYTGQKIYLRFSFDSVDNINNDFVGWYVDNVQVQGIPFVSATSANAMFQANEKAVFSGAGVGNFFGDGKNTIAMLQTSQAIASDNGTTYVQLFDGAPSGSTLTPKTTITAASGLIGTSQFPFIGQPVAGVGDLDNDGFADLVINGIDGDYVIFGKNYASAVNLSTLLNPASPQAIALPTVEGPGPDGLAHGQYVAVGDINGDGRADLGGSILETRSTLSSGGFPGQDIHEVGVAFFGGANVRSRLASGIPDMVLEPEQPTFISDLDLPPIPYSFAGVGDVTSPAGGSRDGLAVDSQGNLYVVSSTANLISKFAPNGTLLNANFITGLNNPTALTFDTTGHLFVANAGSNTVGEYDNTGKLLNSKFITGLNDPTALVVGPQGSQTLLFVANARLVTAA